MLVCPMCSCPVEADRLVVAEWDVKCALCGWTGESSELIEYTGGQYVDPGALIEFMRFLHKDVSPVVGHKLVELGIVVPNNGREFLIFFTKLLISVSRAAFEAVLKGVLGGSRDREAVVLGDRGDGPVQA